MQLKKTPIRESGNNYHQPIHNSYQGISQREFIENQHEKVRGTKYNENIINNNNSKQ